MKSSLRHFESTTAANSKMLFAFCRVEETVSCRQMRALRSQKTHKCSRNAGLKSGFTMVELLVVIGILIILTGLTVSAFSVNEADRVSNSVGTFKNALEGARSRAITSGQIRGLRLIPDDKDFRIVKSMVYVGASDYHNRGQTRVRWDGTNDWWELQFNNAGLDTLKNIGAFDEFGSGYRVEVPAGSGRWLTMVGKTSSINRWRIAEQFQPSEWNTSAGGWSPVPTSSSALYSEYMDYRLELKPTILEGEDPILLDPQTCIDLDGSRVPRLWRGVEDLDGDGSLDTSGSEADEDPTNLFTFSIGYSNSMDILFNPDGTIAGDAKSEGVLNFRFAYVSDVILAEPLRQIPLSSDFTSVSTYPNFIVPADPEKTHKVLTIFTQTGGVLISDIDPTISGSASNGFNNDIATQPFYYARRGRESN